MCQSNNRVDAFSRFLLLLKENNTVNSFYTVFVSVVLSHLERIAEPLDAYLDLIDSIP